MSTRDESPGGYSPGRRLQARMFGLSTPEWWTHVARRQVERMDTALAGPTPSGLLNQVHHLNDIYADAVLCAVALGQVLRNINNLVEDSGRDPKAVEGSVRFVSAAGDPALVRNVLIHIDEYVVGRGWQRDRLRESDLEYIDGPEMTDDVDLVLDLAGVQVHLRAATEEGTALAATWKVVRQRHGLRGGQ